ncbi:MAG: ABC-F family ATP-binding cassette domain-containing protein [Melioribacteraceae bacterium]|nr:ABC-F family ATP-binding cassette domain-containing protein [Melioribacteraceae bacterium]
MIDLVDLSIQYTGRYLFDNVNLKINKGDRISLVGSNGTGKSTLLRLIDGQEAPETGKILIQKGIKVGYLPQEFSNLHGNTLFDEVKNSLTHIINISRREDEINSLLNADLPEDEHLKLVEELGGLNHEKEKVEYYSIDSQIEKVLEGLGFKVNDFTRRTEEFSGGWQMRIELAKILLGNNDIILLDEPTNHLDIDTLQWLIGFLKNYRGSILLVSHDRFFVNAITNKTLEIFNKQLSFYNGNLDAYHKFKEERDIQLEAQFEQQQKKIKETEKFIERFRYKSSKAKQVQSRVKQLEKIDRVELSSSEKEINIRFPDPPRSGAIPIELLKIDKAFGDNIVFKGNNLTIERGEKIAFVGPNGAGKTTLAKIIAGKSNIDAGEVNIGYNTSVSYYAQEVAENLDKELDVLETLDSIGTDHTPGQLRGLLGSFLFSAEDVFKKVKVLSGGEKSRVALAKILLTKANLIVLDEPTNHLDFASKKILQKALVEFKGSLIIVSHDVDFLEPIVHKVIEIRDRKLKVFHGDIEYYLQKINEIGDEKNTVSNQADASLSKKDLKRIEAENRQKKFKATKDIVKKIDEFEAKIEKLEIKKSEIENDLADEKVFSNPELSKQKNSEYEDIKEKLDIVFLEWTELTEQLEEIEKEFE